jgi:hypothetical protein
MLKKIKIKIKIRKDNLKKWNAPGIGIISYPGLQFGKPWLGSTPAVR